MTGCGVTDILAVSEHSHVFRQLRYRYQKRKTFVAIYSDFWEAVAGRPYGNWYQLPIHTGRKPLSDIASKNDQSTENGMLCWIIFMRKLRPFWSGLSCLT